MRLLGRPAGAGRGREEDGGEGDSGIIAISGLRDNGVSGVVSAGFGGVVAP